MESAGTLFGAFYGELVPYPWHDPEHDAYQLFHQRSLAMGWLDRLWGMNDAGWEHPAGASGTGLVSWFQVEAGTVAGDRPLPVRPFLACAGDAVARTGRADLTAVQLLLPVQGIDPATRPAYASVPSLMAVEWFGERDPAARTPVTVALSSGSRELHVVEERLAGLKQDVFVHRSSSSPHGAALPGGIPAPPFDDTFWDGPARHHALLRGELAEWSCDAVGWLGEVVADCAALGGLRVPLLVSVVRDRDH